MNQREKILVLIVVVVGVLFAGRAVKRAYTDKLDSLKNEVAKLEQKKTRINVEKELAQKGAIEWINIGKQTLSMDENETRELFRNEMNKLTADAGLSSAVANLIQEVDRVDRKSRVTALKCKVDAEGSLQQIVQFLFKVYRQPYMVRCTSLRLTSDDNKKATTGRLKMSGMFETLILPPNKMVRKINTAELDPGKRIDVADRLAYANLVDYHNSIKPDLFERYTPPPPPPPPTPTPGPVQPVGPTPTPTPTPTPLPVDHALVLGRILSSPRGQQVVLQNPTNKNVEDKRVEVGEMLYGGTLIFVHPTGAVSELAGQWRFHPIGIALNQCKVLDEQEFPAVFYELTKLKQRAEGISKKDG